MNLDKFIDDGDGLIITPPPDDVEKYNQCHGPGGKFCSSGKGAGGGSGSEAQPEMPTYKYKIDDQVGLSSIELSQIDTMLYREVQRQKVTGLEKVTIKDLGSEAAAYAMTARIEEHNGKIMQVSHIELDPVVVRGDNYTPHKAAVDRGELPFLSTGYAPSQRAGGLSLITHEVAHVKLGEYVTKKTQNEVAALDGMYGDRSWQGLVVKASREGWQGPSRYGQKDYAECFAESANKYLLTGTSGHKGIDNYIEGVLKA